MFAALLATFVVAFFYQWYNYVLFQFYPFGYWLAYGLAFAVCWCIQGEGAFQSFLKFVMFCVFFAALIAQILAWGGAITLPLFHVFAK